MFASSILKKDESLLEGKILIKEIGRSQSRFLLEKLNTEIAEFETW
jgi:hypothetical protein